MHLEAGVVRVAEQLAAAAALGDERTREVAAALAATVAPAVRLAVLEALAAATHEINAGLLDVPGSPTVAVRLDGDEAVVEVRVTDPPDEPAAAYTPDDPLDPVDPVDGTSARISLRLGAALKARVDRAAGEDGVSVNTWLVRAATAALQARSVTPTARRTDPRRITGWIN